MQNYQQWEFRAFELHSFVPLNMLMPNFVALFVASRMTLSKSCCISKGDPSPNLLFSEQNWNFVPNFFGHTDTCHTAFQNLGYSLITGIGQANQKARNAITGVWVYTNWCPTKLLHGWISRWRGNRIFPDSGGKLNSVLLVHDAPDFILQYVEFSSIIWKIIPVLNTKLYQFSFNISELMSWTNDGFCFPLL